MEMAKSVEEYLAKQDEWKEAVELLRELMLETELVEEVKWGIPTYTLNKKHVVGIGSFKAYAGMWFYQGVFLTDHANKLINAQEGVTKALRQWRFQSVEEIREDIPLIRAYLLESIANHKEGLEMKPQRKPLVIPPELQEALEADTLLAQSFDRFNKTRKREFANYISEAKREATRYKRLEKIKPMILEGVGLNDQYR